MKLLIANNVNFHYEIIESVIVKYNEIFEIEKQETDEIYLHINSNKSFEEYILQKYPKIKLENTNSYNYYINCTVYDRDFQKLDIEKKNRRYISHEITQRLRNNPNVLFLTPLSKTNYICSDVLPEKHKTPSNIPIYIIQGNINQGRRDFKLLKTILDKSYTHKFIVKIVGKGHLPDELQNHSDKIIVKSNLNFIDYHKEFSDAYCILPLISKQTQPQYYTKKLTSSINYAVGYDLKCLIDKDLQDIYNLKNVEIYKNINDISRGFANTLDLFYHTNMK
jgi:hypothetical protein